MHVLCTHHLAAVTTLAGAGWENVRPPATATGVATYEKRPLPTWPHWFRPQQYKVPESERAHKWSAPAEVSATAVRPVVVAESTYQP